MYAAHLDQVNLLEIMQGGRLEDVENADDVFVVEVTKELDFSEGTQAEHRMVEGSDALDSDLSLSRNVYRGAIEPSSAPLSD